MIVVAIMDLLKFFILFLIGLLPALPDSSGLVNLVKPVFDLYSNIDGFINVQVCCMCLGFLFIFCNIELLWGIIMWVVRKIPGVE